MDAIGLEENMLEEPVWPELPSVRIYPDQPQGISRDDGEWVLGHKEFRYAVVPEKAGELLLPEVRLDWWDTLANKQRSAVLPEHRVTVLPSEMNPAAVTPPAGTPGIPDLSPGQPGGIIIPDGRPILWQAGTAGFAILWLLTLLLYFRRGPVSSVQAVTNATTLPEEKALLKQLQRACQNSDVSAARKDFAQWVRNYAPLPQRGSMREFAVSCGDAALRMEIETLDASGFATDTAGAWQGNALWKAFRQWQNKASGSRVTEMGEKPDLYQR
jgi:hypothetical protein